VENIEVLDKMGIEPVIINETWFIKTISGIVDHNIGDISGKRFIVTGIGINTCSGSGVLKVRKALILTNESILR
jgi:hypothetical protein